MTNTISKVIHNGTEYEFTDTTYSAGTGISISGTTISNSGVTSVNGSTGAVTVQAQHSVLSITLTAAGWSNNEQTVTATGVTASNSIIISPTPSSITDYTDAMIYCSVQASNSLTFVCDTVPENDIVVNVLILN